MLVINPLGFAGNGITMILVTGGTGFVGSWLKKMQPVGVGIDAVYLHKRQYNEMNWSELECSGIIHLAPVSPEKVLQYAQQHHVRVLYCSSGAIYNVKTEYADNKRRWEGECLLSGCDVVIARLFTFCGEGLDDGKAIMEFTRLAKSNQPIIIHGTGHAIRTYMHGSKMAQWMWAIWERGKSGEAYDVGGNIPITMKRLAELTIKKYHSTSEIVVTGQQDNVAVYVPKNTRKTRELL
jgi:nucleoside-diphosphate-sugar epimerase